MQAGCGILPHVTLEFLRAEAWYIHRIKDESQKQISLVSSSSLRFLALSLNHVAKIVFAVPAIFSHTFFYNRNGISYARQNSCRRGLRCFPPSTTERITSQCGSAWDKEGRSQCNLQALEVSGQTTRVLRPSSNCQPRSLNWTDIDIYKVKTAHDFFESTGKHGL